jgi:hypothetical protein
MTQPKGEAAGTPAQASTLNTPEQLAGTPGDPNAPVGTPNASGVAVANANVPPAQVPVNTSSNNATDPATSAADNQTTMVNVPQISDPVTGELVPAPLTDQEKVAYSKKLQEVQGDNYDPYQDPIITSSAVAEGIAVELASGAFDGSPTLDGLRKAIDEADDELHRQTQPNVPDVEEPEEAAPSSKK